MRPSRISCRMPIVRTGAVLLLAAALAACSANGKLATPGTSSDTGGSGTNTGGGTTTSGTTTPTPTVTVSVNPQVVTPGGTSTITWTTTNATACVASGSWSGAQPANDAAGVTTAALTTVGTYTYALTCTGPGGSGSGSQQIFVGAVSAPTVNVTITPTAIQPGDSATLTWSSTNSTACTATGGTGTDGWNGTLATSNATGLNTGAIATAGQYAYTLTCAGPGGTGSASQNLAVATSAPRRRPPLRSAPTQPCWRRAVRSRSPGMPPMRRLAQRPAARVATTGPAPSRSRAAARWWVRSPPRVTTPTR